MFMPKHSLRIRAFTLLELLVVISIIGILVAMGAASFSVAQKQGRDARRRADIKAVQNVMEQYKAVHGTYAHSKTASNLNDETGCNDNPGTSTSVTINTADGGTFIAAEPTGKTGYYSCANALVDSYCACAKLDNPGKGNSDGWLCENYGAPATGTHYCVKQQQ